MNNYSIKIKTKIFLVFLFLLLSLSIYSQSSNEALDYLNSISSRYGSLSKDIWAYVKAAAHTKNVFLVENKRKALIKSVEEAILNVKNLGSYKEDKTYYNSTMTYLNILDSLLKEDYAKIVNMEEISEQSYDLMEAYLLAKSKANEKMDKATNAVNDQMKKFAEKFNIKLIINEDDISKNLEIAKEVTDYYNKIYLIFFKSYKQELYLLDATNKSNVNEIEQNRTTLIKYSTEDLKKLQSIKPFKNDNSLKGSCEQMLEFFKNEAEDKYIAVTDYFMKKEMFEKVKKAFDLKKDSERTQEDIDFYNNKVHEFNDAVKESNKINKELNSKRQKLIKEWNKSSSAFLDTHVPK